MNVEMDLRELRLRLRWSNDGQQAHRTGRERDCSETARDSDQQRFREQLADDPNTRGAQRVANGNLAAASPSTLKKQDAERWQNARGGDLPALHCGWELRKNVWRQRGELRVGRRVTYAVFETRDDRWADGLVVVVGGSDHKRRPQAFSCLEMLRHDAD